jgi:hypothetical protein
MKATWYGSPDDSSKRGRFSMRARSMPRRSRKASQSAGEARASPVSLRRSWNR